MKTTLDAEWMDAFFQRNNWHAGRCRGDQLGNAWTAAAEVMFAAARLQTSDAAKISRYLTLPLPYVSATMWNLERNTPWITECFMDVATAMTDDPLDEFNLSDALFCAMEQFWGVEQPAWIDLVSLWASMSWVTGGDDLPSVDDRSPIPNQKPTSGEAKQPIQQLIKAIPPPPATGSPGPV